MASNTFYRYDNWLIDDQQNNDLHAQQRPTVFLNTWQTNADINGGTPPIPVFPIDDEPENDIPISPDQVAAENVIWFPSYKQGKAIRLLHDTLFYQYPCVPCSFCAAMLYPMKVLWHQPQANEEMTSLTAYPDIRIHRHPTDASKVAVCNSCKKPSTRQIPVRFVFIQLKSHQTNIFSSRHPDHT